MKSNPVVRAERLIANVKVATVLRSFSVSSNGAADEAVKNNLNFQKSTTIPLY
jgi:hypothetical protein